jgi:hypothetical protein
VYWTLSERMYILVPSLSAHCRTLKFLQQGDITIQYEAVMCKNNGSTPWIRILFQKLTVAQLIKKFPEFYGTQKFIAMFTKALGPIQPTPFT